MVFGRVTSAHAVLSQSPRTPFSFQYTVFFNAKLQVVAKVAVIARGITKSFEQPKAINPMLPRVRARKSSTPWAFSTGAAARSLDAGGGHARDPAARASGSFAGLVARSAVAAEVEHAAAVGERDGATRLRDGCRVGAQDTLADVRRTMANEAAGGGACEARVGGR